MSQSFNLNTSVESAKSINQSKIMSLRNEALELMKQRSSPIQEPPPKKCCGHSKKKVLEVEMIKVDSHPIMKQPDRSKGVVQTLHIDRGLHYLFVVYT